MTLQEAKDQVAKNHGNKDWHHLFKTRTGNDVSSYGPLEEAAELYARSKWDEAIRAYERLNNVVFPTIPEFKP